MNQDNEFRRGWRVLAASCLGIALGVSSLYFYSLGIFIKPLAAEFGWTRGEVSLGALVGTICTAAMSIPVGRMVDRIGSVRVALGSLAFLALGFASLGTLMSGLGSFLVLTAVLSLLTAGSSPVSFTRLVVAAFEHNRGLALGLTLSGAGLGAILTPALLPAFVAEHGWRAGYLTLAGVIVVMLPVLALLLRRVEQPTISLRAPPQPLAVIVANGPFALLGAIFVCASIAILGTVVHFVPMLTDGGYSPVRAGQIASLVGVAAIGGRLAAGWLLDRFRAHIVAFALFAAAAGGLVMLGFGGAAMALPGALIIGLSVGAEVDLMAFFTGRFFPRAVYGQTYGALYALFLVGGAIGPALSGYLYDLTGSYQWALLTSGTLLGLVALATLGLGRVTPRLELEP